MLGALSVPPGAFPEPGVAWALGLEAHAVLLLRVSCLSCPSPLCRHLRLSRDGLFYMPASCTPRPVAAHGKGLDDRRVRGPVWRSSREPGQKKCTTRIAKRNRRCGSRAALILFMCRMQHRIDNIKTKSLSTSTPHLNTIYRNSPFIIIEEDSWPSFMPPSSANCALRVVAHCISPRITCEPGTCRA